MSQVKIQEQIISAITINRLANLKRGETLAKRDFSTRESFMNKLMLAGYSENESNQIFADAKDMAALQLDAE